ncbi:hypothetical protein COCCADRAFT_112548 [Bipolaris zeicola 26-R-13]|uniref:Uncharacterized protein n=1 Tax=Cochliobolus carbonum (strain 26-R-13) TaxID=930089 RepID=W6Y706_COCC2|nr:uncharacterized protein COCCADRAFT_112548 [Bipolaris zeicola 26-R-13]EUC27111.1 hypothetical protein COCCADRAFT_112548 [Bipolaris zeicola 26-R-13]
MQALPRSWSKHLNYSRREESPEEEKLVDRSSQSSGRLIYAKKSASKKQWIKSIAVFLLKGSIVALAIYGAVNLGHRIKVNVALARHENRCECGRNVGEAVAKGCKYDELASAWLPPHCRDEELSTEFSNVGPDSGGHWGYWLDQNGTRPVPPHELGFIADTDDVYWTTTQWHIVHCIYYSLKQFRSKTSGAVIEERYDNEGHIRHCGMVMLKHMLPPKISTFQSAALTSELFTEQDDAHP